MRSLRIRGPRVAAARTALLATVVLMTAVLALCAGPIPAGASTLFALVDTGELFSSEDDGAGWTVRAALPVPDGAALVAGSSTQELFLASETGTIYRSLDAGLNWDAVGAVPASDVVDLAGRDTALLLLTRSGTVWSSTDDGASFTAIGVITAPDLAGFCLGSDGALYAATETGVIHRSSDSAVTWSAVGAAPVSDAVSIRPLGTALYLITETGLTWQGTNLGADWVAVGTASQVTVAGLTRSNGTLVAATREGLVASSLNGSAWDWVGAINQLNVTALANDDPQVVGVPSPTRPPAPIAVSPPWPNPLRAGRGPLSVTVTLAEPGSVALDLYDSQGRRVATRAAGAPAGPGPVVLAWDPGPLPSGRYFLRATTPGGRVAGTTLTLLR